MVPRVCAQRWLNHDGYCASARRTAAFRSVSSSSVQRGRCCFGGALVASALGVGGRAGYLCLESYTRGRHFLWLISGWLRQEDMFWLLLPSLTTGGMKLRHPATTTEKLPHLVDDDDGGLSSTRSKHLDCLGARSVVQGEGKACGTKPRTGDNTVKRQKADM